MFYYRVGYGTWEGGEELTLTHDKQFTDKEFHNMVKEAFVESAIEKIKAQREYDFDERLSDESVNSRIYNVFYERVHKEVNEYLIEHFGFKPLEYQCQHFVDGWLDLLTDYQRNYIYSTPHTMYEEYSLFRAIRDKFLQLFGWVPQAESKDVFKFAVTEGNPTYIINVEYRERDGEMVPYDIRENCYLEQINWKTIRHPLANVYAEMITKE